MGCTSSTAKYGVRTSTETASTDGLSNLSRNNNGRDPQQVLHRSNSKHGVISKNILISLDVRKLAKEKWKVDRGYSSGASSCGSDLDDPISSEHGNNNSNHNNANNGKNVIVVLPVPFDPCTIPRPDQKAIRRNISEKSCLSELKETIEKDGDFAKTIVRMETPFDTPIEEIYDGVLDGKVLGTGVSGTVRRIVHRSTGIKYAVKCLDLTLINTQASLLQLRNEIFIMCQLDHPNVMRIEEVYESNNELYIVQEICVGGDLFDRLDQQPHYHYTEEQCASLVKQMLSSVRYLHSKGIIHRDLKLENFLFSTKGEDSDLKLIDFGLSKHFEAGQHHCEMVGTPYTVAPEILKGDYDEKSDIWSLGVITFLLLCGETPFGGLDGENLRLVKENIMRASVKFVPAEAWDLVSDEGRSFVQALLDPDSSKRPTAKEAQRCKWIQEYAKKEVTEGNKLNPKTIGALMNFKESSDMQRLLSEVLSFTLLPEQIVDLRKEFEKLDSHGDGEITLGSLKRILMQNAEIGALGALSEYEVEEIFESVKLPVRRGETTIRWHEFLAACLSRAEIDDRNLRLAFDRLDTHRKGFITFDDLADILGNTTDFEALEKIWEESLLEINSRLDRITLHDFKRIMKGRPKEGMTVFIQSSPGLLPAFSDSALMPLLSLENTSPSPALSHVIEEDHEVQESIDEQMEMEKSSNTMSSSVFINGNIDTTKRPPYRGSLWSMSTPNSAMETSRPDTRIALSKSLSSASGTSLDSVLLSPLAANRALYRKSLLRHSIVSDAQFHLVDYTNNNNANNTIKPNEMMMRSSTTRASLVMKRGTLHHPIQSLRQTVSVDPNDVGDDSSGGLFDDGKSKRNHNDSSKNKNNSTIDTIETAVSLD